MIAVAAPHAGAAVPVVVGCGFHLGGVDQQGAAGTLYFIVTLEPANPAQSCTVPATVTVSAVPRTGGSYVDIDNNPLTATESATFRPNRRPPVFGVRWGGLHCADPAVPGLLTFATGSESDVNAVAIAPSTCGPGDAPHSSFAAFPLTSDSAVGIAATPDDHGYRSVDQIGNITAEGSAASLGTQAESNVAVVGIVTAPTGNGAWVVAADGGIFAYDSATFHGSLGNIHLNQPIVGMAATPDGGGYWLVAADGGIFAFGDATFRGSLGSLHLNAPIVGMAATPDGGGYWLAASDGGVFAFGDAVFDGSLGSVALNAPVVGMAADPHGGYWLVTSDGGVFAFGGAPFKGSAGALNLVAPISGMASTSTGEGYWLVSADNGIFTYGDAHFFGASPFE
jgi:hypothetical protein